MEPTGASLNLVSSEGQVFPLGPGRTTIGRDPGQPAGALRRYVSRAHAAVDCDGRRCTLTDLGSSHGTTLNRQRLQPHQAYPLGPGDRIVLANQILVSVQGAVPPGPPPATPSRRTSPFVLALAVVAVLPVAALAALIFFWHHLHPPDPAPMWPTPTPELGTSNLYVEYILDASGSMNETLPDGTVKLAVAKAAHRAPAGLPARDPHRPAGLRAPGPLSADWRELPGHRAHRPGGEGPVADHRHLAPRLSGPGHDAPGRVDPPGDGRFRL